MLIAHTTTRDEDDTALAHAVALAVHGGARLASVHASFEEGPRPVLKGADELLRRWGLPEGRVTHERIVRDCCEDAADTLLDTLRRLEPDLLVAATHARTGVGRLVAGSVAESVARNLRVPSLLLPLGGVGFVDRQSGRTDLSRILVPAGNQNEGQQGVDAAVALAGLAGFPGGELVLLHVEDGHPPPDVRAPSGFSLTRRSVGGPLEPAILEVARELDACLVVMATHGHDGVLDVLFGSHTERVLHALSRPLLWVPFEAQFPDL
jgi:nucleotide-binding universal stress UspA family protein